MKKITPTIAKILASKIVDELEDLNSIKRKNLKIQIIEELNKDKLFIEGKKIRERLMEIEEQLNEKYSKKIYNNNNLDVFGGVRHESVGNIFDYQIKRHVIEIPNIDSIKNNILLKDFNTGEDEKFDSEAFIKEYIKHFI